MFDSLLEKFQRNILAIKQHVETSDTLRNYSNARLFAVRGVAAAEEIKDFSRKAPNLVNWKVIDHCSAVMQIYALYERFVHELLTTYLGFLENNVPYAQLEKKFRDEHRRKIGQIFMDMDKDRFKTLSFQNIVADLSNAVSGHASYRLLPEAMLIHTQNLRMDELRALTERCGLTNVPEWISGHRSIKKFFDDQGRQSDKAEAELTQLVQYRNEAAHGSADISTVLGAAVLIEYADFISVMCEVLAERAHLSLLQTCIGNGKAHLVGTITEKYSENRAVAVVSKQTFKVGDTVYLSNKSYCYNAKIIGIKDHDVAVNSLTVVSEKELGFQFNVEPFKRADIHYVTS